MNIEVSCYNQKVLNVNFGILEILQSCMRRIRIDIQKPKNVVVVKEQD